MKKAYFSLLLLLLWANNCMAQFHIITTEDNYTNLRGEYNKIINTVEPGTIVAETMPEFEWADYNNYLFVTYMKDSRVYAGNIHRSQLCDISGFQPLLLSKNSNDCISFSLSDEIRIDIKGCSQSNNPYSKDYIAFSSIEILMDKKMIELPSEAYEDLYALHPDHNSRVYINKESKTLYIIMSGSGGGDSYLIMWVVNNGKYTGRHLCGVIPNDQICNIQKGIPEREFYKHYLKEDIYYDQ